MRVRLELVVAPLLARGNYQVEFINRTASLPKCNLHVDPSIS